MGGESNGKASGGGKKHFKCAAQGVHIQKKVCIIRSSIAPFGPFSAVWVAFWPHREWLFQVGGAVPGITRPRFSRHEAIGPRSLPSGLLPPLALLDCRIHTPTITAASASILHAFLACSPRFQHRSNLLSTFVPFVLGMQSGLGRKALFIVASCRHAT